MDSSQQRHRVAFLTSVAYWAVIIAIVFFVLKYLVNLVMPFFIAVIIAALARPIAKYLSSPTRRKKLKNGEYVEHKRRLVLHYNLAAILGVIAVIIVIAGFIALIVSPLISFIVDKVKLIEPAYSELMPQIEEVLANTNLIADRFDGPLAQMLENAIPELISTLGGFLAGLSGKIIGWVSSFAASLPNLLLQSLICLIATVFISLDFEFIRKFVIRNLKSNALLMAKDIKDSLIDIVWQFIKSYFLIFLITTAEIALGLKLIGMDSPLLFGVMIAIFDAFPIVGSGMILLPWAIITLITDGLWKGLGMIILYAVVVCVRQIIEPRIVGRHVGLRPIVSLLCMYVGTKLFGGLGLFTLPIAAAIIADLNESGSVHFYVTPGENTNTASADNEASQQEPEATPEEQTITPDGL